MILHFLLAAAHATSFYIPTFQDFTREARYIARGTINNIHSENSISPDGAKVIYTYAAFDLKDVMKGNFSKTVIQIRKLGGTKDGYTVEIPGSPEFKEGEDAVLFLGPEKEDQSYEIMSLELGKYVVEEKNGKQVLKGGIFNYAHHDDHNASESHPENLKAWTVSELKTVIADQAQKTSTSSSGASSSGIAASATVAAARGSATPQNVQASLAPKDATSFTPEATSPRGLMIYLVFGLGLTALLIFFFRKR